MTTKASAALEDLLRVMDFARGPNEAEPPALQRLVARTVRQAFASALTREGQERELRILAKGLRGAPLDARYVAMASLLESVVRSDFPDADRDAARVAIAGVVALDSRRPNPGPCPALNAIEATYVDENGKQWPMEAISPRQILSGLAEFPGLKPAVGRLCGDVADGGADDADRELVRKMSDALEAPLASLDPIECPGRDPSGGRTEGPPTLWSKPDSPKQWAQRFTISRDTMREWLKTQKVRNKKLSARRYCIASEDLPKDEMR